ncbi:universal stress protein family protein [Klebsormidium nitens]|uniref:Universal stress protein family protein n=1 Tax=Klebsormidium nitens TaxID=105231 RepID=A0A1Y1HKX6_KLENI|nr:universal stress protein family protein [Klebsormidium nitens]|eukprot:GAQ79264.1 universal stress protein family protein [Klebsormidium nitens]
MADAGISAHKEQEPEAAKSPPVQTPEQPHPASGQRFLCAIDGSEGSKAAFKFLLEKMVVAERGDSIVLFEACKQLSREPMEPESRFYPDLIFINDLQRKMVQEEEERRSRQQLQKLGELASAINVPCEVVVATGDPREVIPKFISEHPVEIVAVGSRGLGPMQRLFLGSVSSHLVHHLSVPVLVVSPPRAKP